MSEFFNQYFDFHFMGEHFGEVLEGFLQNLLLFAVAAVLALAWGLAPRAAAPAARAGNSCRSAS